MGYPPTRLEVQFMETVIHTIPQIVELLTKITDKLTNKGVNNDK